MGSSSRPTRPKRRLNPGVKTWLRKSKLISSCRCLLARPTRARPWVPALGQHGVNIMEFCKAFNAETQGTEPGLPIPVVITVYNDRSFTFIKKTPAGVCAAAQGAKIKKGSGTPEHQQGGQGKPRAAGRDRRGQKWPDLTAADMDAAVRTIAGSARSAGIEVEGVN